MVLELNGCLKVCYSNKYLEDRIKEFLKKENIETFKDPKRGYITLYNKPLAALTIKGWGRTEQRNVIVYCSVLWSCVSENNSLAMLTDEMKQDINKTETKLQEGTSKSVIQVPVIPVWVPYKTLNNLTELPIGSIHKVTAIGYAKHYGTDKLVVQLEDGTLYQAGEFLERTKEDSLIDCKIIIEEYRVQLLSKIFIDSDFCHNYLHTLYLFKCL